MKDAKEDVGIGAEGAQGFLNSTSSDVVFMLSSLAVAELVAVTGCR